MTEAASAVLVESTITDCAGTTGGGLLATNQAIITLKGSRFERCTAARGGAAFTSGSALTLKGHSRMDNCTASAWGGGMYFIATLESESNSMTGKRKDGH